MGVKAHGAGLGELRVYLGRGPGSPLAGNDSFVPGRQAGSSEAPPALGSPQMLAASGCSSAAATSACAAGASTPRSTAPRRRSAASSCAAALRPRIRAGPSSPENRPKPPATRSSSSRCRSTCDTQHAQQAVHRPDQAGSGRLPGRDQQQPRDSAGTAQGQRRDGRRLHATATLRSAHHGVQGVVPGAPHALRRVYKVYVTVD